MEEVSAAMSSSTRPAGREPAPALQHLSLSHISWATAPRLPRVLASSADACPEATGRQPFSVRPLSHSAGLQGQGHLCLKTAAPRDKNPESSLIKDTHWEARNRLSSTQTCHSLSGAPAFLGSQDGSEPPGWLTGV